MAWPLSQPVKQAQDTMLECWFYRHLDKSESPQITLANIRNRIMASSEPAQPPARRFVFVLNENGPGLLRVHFNANVE